MMINDETDWKTSDLNVDSLWLINKRDSSGKHENNYHGNFVPQIPYQLIKRYTQNIHFVVNDCDVCNSEKMSEVVNQSFKWVEKQSVDFLIAHPPYMDIVKFTDKKEDLSAISDLNEFIEKFTLAMKNGLQFLEKNKYFAVVIGDVYKKSEVIPLGFYVMKEIA